MAADAAMSMAFELRSVSKEFITRNSERVSALKDVTLASATGEITCLVGPTGSGKSTALRLLAGLEEPMGGEALVAGQLPAKMRGQIGYLTQSHTLMPWMTIYDNVALAMRIKGFTEVEVYRAVQEILEGMGLGDAMRRYPHEVSGGMLQRAAIGRLIAQEARYWLMDEPFSSLDERSQHALQALVLELVKSSDRSLMFVTHSIDEAVWLADRVVVFSASPGQVVEQFEIDLPRPRARMAAAFGERMERIRQRIESVI